jgi:uncharacterized protein (UPF0212 family)
MDALTTSCPYCGEDLKVVFIDVGDQMEPTMMMSLVCDCQEWLEREMECSVEYALAYGEIEKD